MCPYVKFNPDNPNQIPICEYLKGFCTLCVLGNRKTFNAALEASENDIKKRGN